MKITVPHTARVIDLIQYANSVGGSIKAKGINLFLTLNGMTALLDCEHPVIHPGNTTIH